MRRRYLIAYDVADNKRRDTLFRLLRDHGDHAQFSVFFCDLNDRELARLRTILHDKIHHGEDQVMVLDLGSAASPLVERLEVIGKPHRPPTSAFVV